MCLVGRLNLAQSIHIPTRRWKSPYGGTGSHSGGDGSHVTDLRSSRIWNTSIPDFIIYIYISVAADWL